MIQKLRKIPRYMLYLILIGTIGSVLIVWAFVQFIGFQDKLNFFLFVLLGALSQIAATTATVKSKTGVTYAISPAISLAAVPFFGPAAGVLIESVTNLSLWLIKPADEIHWKKSLPQLVFNTTMGIIAIFAGGYVYQIMANSLTSGSWLTIAIPWLLAAFINDQFNLWILTIMLRLQHGRDFHIFTIWRENAWAIPIVILSTSIGGGFLAYSFSQLGWVGISIFFLPLVLSAYAFRLYVRQMQGHMDNLENIVAERTAVLEQVMQEKDAFLAVLTHDMKSPLTSINLYASMIKDYPHILEKKPHMIDTVLRSQETLTDIVNNIIDLEKLKAGEPLNIEKEDFDFVALTEKVVEIVRAQAENKAIDLQLVNYGTPIFVQADRRHMERVLNNLISNAVKYTQKQGSVVVTLLTQDNQLSVRVQDSGVGIPAKDIPFIFDHYRRVTSHKKLAAGTGLGLAITKALVEAHDGTIEVASEEGEGSMFTVGLPIVNSAAQSSIGGHASHISLDGRKSPITQAPINQKQS